MSNRALTTASRASSVIASWSKAVGIESGVSEKKGINLTLKGKDGKPLDVVISDGETPTIDGSRVIVVKTDEVLSCDLSVALAAFHAITEAAGFGKPVPVNRGEEPKGRRLNQTDDFDLIALRHKEFRAAPNLKAEDYKPFEMVIQSACRAFYRKNYYACKEMMLEVDDLRTYALGWTTNYLHKYNLLSGTQDENRKLLRTHLRQRFAEFAKNLHAKKADCIPTQETYHICTAGNVDGEVDDTVPMDDDYTKRHKVLDTRNAQARRVSARKLLADSLAALPHDEMVEKLSYVALNPSFQNLDAVDEAKYMLEEHRKTCPVCQK